MLAGFTLEDVPPRSFALLEAARVYHQTWRDAGDGMYVDSVAQISRHSSYPGFRGLLIREDATRTPVAMTYGHTSRPGQWWHERVAPLLPPEAAGWLDDCFVVVELAVLPAYRRRGLGRTLMEHLTRARPEPRAALSTQCDNQPARALYTVLGWHTLIDGMQFSPDTPPYVVMGRTLRRET